MAQRHCIFIPEETATKYKTGNIQFCPQLTLANNLPLDLLQHNPISHIRNYFQYEANLYRLYGNSDRYRNYHFRKQNRILK